MPSPTTKGSGRSIYRGCFDRPSPRTATPTRYRHKYGAGSCRCNVGLVYCALAYSVRFRGDSDVPGDCDVPKGMRLFASSVYQSPAKRARKVHLLALPTDTQSLYFYTARIPSAFLDKFDRPSRYFPSNPVRISYYCIPLERATKMIRAMDYAISTVKNEVL